GEYSIPELKLKKLVPGKARWVSQHFKALKDHTGKVEKVIILTTDITAFKEAELSLTRQTFQLEKLLSAAGQLTESIDLNRVLNQIAEIAMDIVGGSSNTILLVDKESRTLKPVVAIDPEYSDEILASPAPINGSYTGKAIKAKRGMIFNDMSDGEGFHIVETPEDLDQRIIAVPLMEDNQAIGGMCLSRHGEYFTEEDLILANTFAAYASTALKNARVHYDLKQEMEERNRAERELLMLRKAVETSAEAIFLTNAKGIFTYVNSGFTKTYGWSPEEVVGIHTPRILKSGKLKPKNYKQFWDKILNGEIVKGELVNKAKDDSVKYVDSSVNPVFNNNKIEGFLAIQKDITEQVKAAQREEKIQEQLRQSQRLESIGRLAGGVAHEINNPLMGIINYADLIQESIADETLKEYAQGIMEEGDRMAKIVKNLLSFARREEDDYSPALIEDIIENSLALISSVFRRDQLTVLKDLAEDLPKIKCRSHQIQQVIVNLLSNARYALNLKYPGFHENKIIKVSAKLIQKNGRDWVRTTVEDHGSGIPEDIIDKIFEPFFTTKSRSIGSEEKGTGLGLAISYGIIEDHRGEVKVESESGEFTRFHVDLQVDNNW
ncbi:MAG: PAS domain S-box protein, partial [FCB group bacterium]|nr:PAS domain S-box protein [FCB group bacterium]